MIRCVKYPHSSVSTTYKYTVKCPECGGTSEYSGFTDIGLTKAQNVRCGHCPALIVNCENLGKNKRARMRYHKCA